MAEEDHRTLPASQQTTKPPNSSPTPQVNVQINNFVSGANGLSLTDLQAIDKAYPNINFGARFLEDPLKQAEHNRQLENSELKLAAKQIGQEGRRVLLAQSIIIVAITSALAIAVFGVYKEQSWIVAPVIAAIGLMLWRANVFGHARAPAKSPAPVAQKPKPKPRR